MSQRSGTRKMLMELLETSESVNVMKPVMRARLEDDISRLSGDQMEVLIGLFLQEREGVADLKDKIAVIDENIDGLLVNVKMAGKGLNKALLGVREKEAHTREIQESESLLNQLDNE